MKISVLHDYLAGCKVGKSPISSDYSWADIAISVWQKPADNQDCQVRQMGLSSHGCMECGLPLLGRAVSRLEGNLYFRCSTARSITFWSLLQTRGSLALGRFCQTYAFGTLVDLLPRPAIHQNYRGRQALFTARQDFVYLNTITHSII